MLSNVQIIKRKAKSRDTKKKKKQEETENDKMVQFVHNDINSNGTQ